MQCYGSGSLIAMEVVSLMWRHSHRLDAHNFEITFEKQRSGKHLLCNKRHVNPGSSSCGHEQRNRTQNPKLHNEFGTNISSCLHCIAVLGSKVFVVPWGTALPAARQSPTAEQLSSLLLIILLDQVRPRRQRRVVRQLQGSRRQIRRI